jgi:uncharacterized membrane-anchored protein
MRDVSVVKLPGDHPLRYKLNDEVHARPPEPLYPPCRSTFLALLSDWSSRDEELRMIGDLCRHFNVAPPEGDVNHFSGNLGAFRLKWERHGEFARYQFIQEEAHDEPFSHPAINRVPGDWVGALPGELLTAMHVTLLPGSEEVPNYEDIAARHFAGNVLVGACVASGAGRAFTDFRIHADGFSRVLMDDISFTPRQAGRAVQRMFEIEIYRMLALLALPAAQDLRPFLADAEQQLAGTAAALQGVKDEEEPALYGRLTALEASIETRRASNHFRFAAGAAYYGLVKQRIADLREQRIQGLQTFQEFTERRLAPAMSTCEAMAGRQEAVSERIARATRLLSTRVDLTRQRQNQALLTSMNRRAKLQLRLQQTVEGLSVAAISYYIVGLIGYAAKSVKALGVDINPDLVMGLSIPFVVGLAALGLRRVHKMVTQPAG